MDYISALHFTQFHSFMHHSNTAIVHHQWTRRREEKEETLREMVLPSLFNFMRGWVRGVKAWLHSTNWFSVVVAVLHLHHLYFMINLKMLKNQLNYIISHRSEAASPLYYSLVICDLFWCSVLNHFICYMASKREVWPSIVNTDGRWSSQYIKNPHYSPFSCTD